MVLPATPHAFPLRHWLVAPHHPHALLAVHAAHVTAEEHGSSARHGLAPGWPMPL